MAKMKHPATRSVLEDGTSRRDILKGLAAIGLTGPAALAALRNGGAEAAHPFTSPGELVDGIEKIITSANSSRIASYTTFEIKGTDMPWKDIDLDVAEGQNVTFLLSGRWWIVRELDVWVEPGMPFFARVGGATPIYNPMKNTGTMTASRNGGVSLARAIGDWADENAENVSTPAEIYQQGDGLIQGVAIAWKGDALAGLRDLRAQGDVAGALSAEITRLQTEPPSPEGWKPMYVTGNPGIFSTCAEGEICCHTHKDACLLQRDLSVALTPGAKLDWRWNVAELPSAKTEETLLTHDYLSMAVEFDDGQDITYMWSSGLPVGHVFRCPIPQWTPIETHIVVRTGRNELGQWLSESRNIYDDYKQHINGSATRVVSVWIIALSFFQRGTGNARFSDILVNSDGMNTRLL